MAGNSLLEHSEKAEMKVVTLTATQVEMTAQQTKMVIVLDTIEVVAQVINSR